MLLNMVPPFFNHARMEPIYGNWMLEKLAHFGNNMSAGTLYPGYILWKKRFLLKKVGLMTLKFENIHCQALGVEVLDEARKKHTNCSKNSRTWE